MESMVAAESLEAPGSGGVGCWPLSPQGRGKQGWFWASDNHQFWPLLHGDTKPQLAVPGEEPCFFHLSCGQF